MKVFTSLMKTLIMIVSLAVSLMLVMSIVPILTGGVTIENTEGFNAAVDTSDMSITITGELTVKSTLPKDVTDLTVKVNIVSTKPGLSEISVLDFGPNVIGSGQSVPLKIEAKLPYADIMAFLLANNINRVGVYLPLEVDMGAAYSGMAKVDFATTYLLPLSKEGSLNVDASRTNENGDIYGVDMSIHTQSGDLINSVLGSANVEVELEVPGITDRIKVNVSNVPGSNTINISVSTGDATESIGLMELLKAMEESENYGILSINGESHDVGSENLSKLCNLFQAFVGGLSHE